jgi:hypothetical protein
VRRLPFVLSAAILALLPPSAPAYHGHVLGLQHDDRSCVVAAYGGYARTPSGSPLCPLYPAIATPRALKASYEPATNELTASFVRPSPPAIPAFIVPVP